MKVIFDIDGTLTQTCGVDEECFLVQVESVLGITEVNTDWTTYQHVTDRGILEELSQQRRNSPLLESEHTIFEEQMGRALGEKNATHFHQVPGAAEFFSHLANSSEYAVALATGACRSSAQTKLQKAGIDHASVPLLSSSNAISREEIMKLAAAELNTTNDKICYFGDGLWDLKACKNLGWHFIGIGEGIATLAQHGAPHTFADFSEPEKILHLLQQF